MDNVAQGLKEQLSSIVAQFCLPVFSKKLDDHISFLNAVKRLQRVVLKNEIALKEKEESLKTLVAYKKELNLLVESYVIRYYPKNFDQLFHEFINNIDDYIGKIPLRISVIQEDDHFASRMEDHVVIKMAKALKLAVFHISKTPEYTVNVIRKILKKPQKPVKRWMRKIKLRNIANFYLKEQLAIRMKEILSEVNRMVCITTIPAWSADESINENIHKFVDEDKPDNKAKNGSLKIDRTIAGIKEDKINIAKSLLDLVDRTYKDFESACQKAGTIELSNYCFNKYRINRRHRALNRTVRKIERGWHTTRKGLFDDWGIDNELYCLIFSALSAYYETLHKMKSGLGDHIYPGMDSIKEFLFGSAQRIEASVNAEDQFRVIEQERNAIRSNLSGTLVPEISEYLAKLDYSGQVKYLTGTIQKSISMISGKRAISKTNDYTKPFRRNNIHYVSPYDLISFECLPKLLGVADSVESTLDERLGLIKNMVFELGQIAEFNLETALEHTKDIFVSDNPAEIAAQGIIRTLERADLIRMHLSSLIELMEKDLFKGFKVFIDDLEQFTDNSNIIEIRVRILRGKASKRIRVVRKQVFNQGKQFILSAVHSARKYYQLAGSRLKRITKKYGISIESETITADLAGFLSDAHQSIHKLPYVYQRLFKIAPLQDQRFFVGRLSEIEMLQHAFSCWSKGQFSSTLVTGEKGSGATSLINLFLGGLDEKIKVLRIKPDITLCSERELIDFLNEGLDQHIDGIDGWTAFLQTHQKAIIVLEDCQRLYLKKVNGFEALQKLNELIQLTGRNIFWILTFTEYAYQYLDKTIIISDYFRNVVKLELFEDNTLVEIIDQRHKVSGFNIVYEPSPSDLLNKKFRNQPDEIQQRALQSTFFSELGRIAHSNIRLALTYWLQSIKEIKGNTIVIKSLKDFNLSFLNNLSATKLFALRALIMHEMLSEEDFGKVLNISGIHARRILHPLFEDGILLYEHSFYMINPLLYRQITELLKNRNLLH